MTEQLKAEAYVRKQRPALMETSRVGITAMYNYEINLQDWLGVLRKAKVTVSMHVMTDCIIVDPMKGKNQHLLKFDLTTGQPATEADYKAFNKIVSV